MARIKSEIGPWLKQSKSGMDAMGRPIPAHRLTNALETMRDRLRESDGSTIDTGRAMHILGRAARYLEEDQPYKAMSILFPHNEYSHLEPSYCPLDLTGAYRIMATLLAG